MNAPDQATRTMIANLEQNTGCSLAEWVRRTRAQGFAKHGEMVTWLKEKHALGHGYANLVAHAARADEAGPVASADDQVAAWFAGEKAALRPIYDALVAEAKAFGGDVEFAPKKGYMSLRRTKQFACLVPSTKTRFDLGLQLKGVPPAGRFELSGSWNAMVSHRVRLDSVAQVDAEVRRWLRQAYDAA